MNHIEGHLRLAGTLVAAAFLFAPLFGCGGSKPPTDPFVGTWRAPSGAEAPRWVIIAKVDGNYLATVKLVFYGKVGGRIVSSSPSRPARVSLERVGDTLTGMFWSDFAVKIRLLPASGHLTWTEWVRGPTSQFSSIDRDWTSKPVEMTRVSNSTAPPSPSP